MKKPAAKKRDIEAVALEFALTRRVGFDDDRSQRVGASEVGQCARKIVYDKLGIAPDNGVQPTNGFATRGDHMEDVWIAPLVERWVRDHGGELLFHGQANQVTYKGKGVPLSSTPDGLAVGCDRKILARYGVPDIGKGGLFVPEFKSLDPRYGRHKLPKTAHGPQVLTQLGMIRHATEYRPVWGAVAYCDASDWFDWKWHPVQWNEKAFNGLVQRAARILACKDPNQVAPEGKVQGGAECNECPFARRCLGFTPWVPGEDKRALKPAQVAEVGKIAAKYHAAEQAVEKAKQRVRDIEAELYATLAKVKRPFVMGKGFVVNAKQTAAQSRDDTAAMKAWIKKKGGNPEGFKKLTKPGASLSVEAR